MLARVPETSKACSRLSITHGPAIKIKLFEFRCLSFGIFITVCKNNFSKVKSYLIELGHNISFQDENNQLLVITDERAGICNLVLGCADPILIMEQNIFDINPNNTKVFKELLKKNRDIVHGAFVLNESGDKVIFRDTLQLENLDLNELEGSINSLGLLLSEYSSELIKFSKK